MKKTLLIIALFCSIQILSAQEEEPEVTGVPVDGGIVTITLIAAAYGAKRHKENKDKSL